MIRLRLFGPPGLARADGTPIRSVLAQPKRFALLSYLSATHPSTRISRDTLCALLWPESDDEHARNRLRQMLHGLRRSLGRGVVTGEGEERVGVDADRLWCDARAFRVALSRGDSEEALRLFGGPFLQGFHLTDAAGFERWMETERRRFIVEAVAAAWRMVEAAEVSGDAVASRRWAERATELEPYDEEGFRRFLGVLERQADRAAAVRVFDNYARRLSLDLGLAPSAETLRLVGRLRAAASSEYGLDREPVETDAAAVLTPSPAPLGESAAPPVGRLEAPAQEPAWRAPWLRVAALAVLVVVVGIAVGALRRRRRNGSLRAAATDSLAAGPAALPPDGVVPPRSIAVLPFQNLSSDSDNAYFAVGIQDEILSDLAGIADLRVISRESVIGYEDHPVTARAIGRELGVAHLLEGTVQREGHRVRISVQLIDARQDTHEWAGTYDRQLGDVFSIESEVARKVAATLEARLSAEDVRRLATRPTANMAAHDAYLEGRAYQVGGWIQGGDYLRAVDAYTRAVELDSTFAVAWAHLGVTQSLIYWFGYDRSPGRTEAARRAVEKAVALAPDAGETQLALGHYEFLCRSDMTRALAAYRRASVSLPNDARVEWALGNIDRRAGRWSAALEHEERAMILDPRDRFSVLQAAWTHVTLRQFDQALDLADRALTLAPGDMSARVLQADIFQARGDLDGARRALTGLAPTPEEPAVFTRLLDQALYARDYASARTMLRAALTSAGSLTPQTAASYRVDLGFAERLAGNARAARAPYAAARRLLRSQIASAPDDPSAFALLGLAEAGLGHEGQAVAAAGHAVALARASGNQWEEPAYEERLAEIDAQLGRTDAAIASLRHLLAVPYTDGSAAPLTAARLRIDPVWDPIRRDPRFQALLDSEPSSTARMAAPHPGR